MSKTSNFIVMQKHNFSAGPAILHRSVIEEAAKGVLDIAGSGLSILEISHRGPIFTEILDEARSLVREILGLSEGFEVLYLTGGASTQFCMVPMNLLDEGHVAAYIDTGTWSTKAIKEAKLLGGVDVIASSADEGYNYIPKLQKVSDRYRYLHLTTNNTIYGTEFKSIPESDAPIVADMSSDIFSYPIENIERYGIIYAGAQKNLGPAGTTLVIVRKDLLGQIRRNIPTMLDYQTHIKKGSSFNTPPVFPIYACLLSLRWLRDQGGPAAMKVKNDAKASTLYSEIDRNSLFRGIVQEEDRSHMNATFAITRPELEDDFARFAEQNGAVGLKGHRSVGGFRASLYNALPQQSVDYLVELMQNFEDKHA